MPPSTPSPSDKPGILGFLRGRLRAVKEQDEAKRQLEQRRLHMLERLAALLLEGKIENCSAIDIYAETATSADVPELIDRRCQLNMAAQFVDAARQKQAGNLEPWRNLLAFVAKNGALLEHEGYSAEDVMAKVCSPQYVISHARGSVIDPTTGALRSPVWAADAQIEIPVDGDSALLSFVPDPTVDKDAFFPQQRELAERVAADMRAHPASVAVLQDVSVAPYQPHVAPSQRYAVADYRNKKLASAATNHALGRIERDINPGRTEPIRYLIANMFRVPSVTLAEGPEVLFDEPITNDISVLVHSLGSAYRRCFLGWQSPETSIVAPDGSVIKASWLTAVRILGRKS